MTSEIAASIAVGGTLHLVNQSRKRRKIDQERGCGSRAERTGCRTWPTATPPGNSVTPPDGIPRPVSQAGQGRAAGPKRTEDH